MSNLVPRKKFLSKFGLQESPYSTNPNARFLYFTESHREALATIDHVIDNKEGAALIVGEPGTGKTTILWYVLSAFRESEDILIGAIENNMRFSTPFQMVKNILGGLPI
jgi:general secretion pathway protein A